MPSPIPSFRTDPRSDRGSAVSWPPITRGTERTLQRIESQTVARLASVRGHAAVQTEKLHAVDQLTREAITGQAMLHQWAVAVAHGDPFVADEMRFFADIARLGKAELIADTVSDFCQEGRR